MSAALPDLPPLAEVAVDLFLWANSAARAVHDGEILAARGDWGYGFHVSIEELRRTAESSGKLYRVIRWLGDDPQRERLFLDFLAGLASDEAPELRKIAEGAR